MARPIYIRLLAIALFAVPALPAFAGEASPAIEIRLSAEEMVVADPGTVLKISALTLNRSGLPGDVEECLNLPPGWEVPIQGSSRFRLGAEERTVRLLVLHIPPTFPAGVYDITYGAGFADRRAAADTVGFTVQVLSRIDVKAEFTEGAGTVIAGEAWRGSLTITNNGNCRVAARIDGRVLPVGAVRVVPDIIVLGPSASETVVLTFKPDDDLRHKTGHSVEVRVRPEAGRDDIPYARASASIDVVPRVTSVPDKYHRLPSQVEFIAAFEEAVSRYQVDIRGSGTLDEAGNRNVGFLMRGPDIEDVGRYGRRDEYWFRYQDGNGNLTVGDRMYSLSYLTQRFVYGRGVQAELDLSKVAVGGLHVANRDLTPSPTSTGAHIALRPHEEFELRGNFLAKSADAALCPDCDRNRVYSLEARLSHGNTFGLATEYGFSRYGAEAIEDDAYRVESRGRILERFTYNLETVHTGPDYAGLSRGFDYTTAGINARISKALRAHLFYSLQENSPHDTTSSASDRVRNLRCGLSCLSPAGFQLNIDYGRFERCDRLLPSDHDFVERAAMLGLGKVFGPLSLHARAELARVEDRLRGLWRGPFGRYSLSWVLSAGRGQTFIAYARGGRSRFTDKPERERSFGLSSRSQIAGCVRLNLDFTTSMRTGPTSKWQHSLISNLTIDLPNSHSLSVRGHIFRKGDGDDRESALFLVYGVPTRIPTSRRKSTGTLKGTVYDAELAGRPPIGGIILSIGDRYAASDEDGEFVFPAIEPGRHLLQIGQESLGGGKTTADKTPMEIEIEGGETTKVEIPVVTACSITGEARLFAAVDHPPGTLRYGLPEGADGSYADSTGPDDTLDLLDAGGLGVIVEITNGIEIFRQASDTNGRFHFQHIRPGIWKIRFYPRDLPDLYRFESDQMEVSLDPGEERHVTARAVPEIRPIHMTNGGRIRVASDPSD